MTKSLERKTRGIFHKIHVAQGEDPYIYQRLKNLFNTEYFKVPPDFFKGKICLDAGCGSNANATYRMLELGAKKVYAFDLNRTIFKSVPKHLKPFEGRYELGVGSVLNLKYDDNFFDFVYCAGVLCATPDIFRGLKELKRVTKAGGILYADLYGKGGLMRYITTSFRNLYKKDKDFKSLIDNLDEKLFVEAVQWVMASMRKHGDNFGASISAGTIASLLDKDLVLTIKDRITAPIYAEISEKELFGWFKRNGFKNIQRLTRYPRYKNIRRFLAPFYERYDNKFSKILYGSDYLHVKAQKGPLKKGK